MISHMVTMRLTVKGSDDGSILGLTVISCDDGSHRERAEGGNDDRLILGLPAEGSDDRSKLGLGI